MAAILGAALYPRLAPRLAAAAGILAAPRSTPALHNRMTAAAGSAAALPAASAAAGSEQAVQANPDLQHSEVLLATNFGSKDSWAAYLRQAGLRVLVHPEDTQAADADLSRVEFAICWAPPPGLLQRCPNLKAIQSMGAGVDSLIGDATLPRAVPLLRVIDPLMSERMATWVLWGVINCQRKCDEYLAAQRERRWAKDVENFRSIDNGELRVGIMGLGVMGGAVAAALLRLGYRVSAWTRRPRGGDGTAGVACFAGAEQLRDFAERTDVLVCLLPLTDETRGIVDARLLGWLPRGASVINAARGAHLVEGDLLAALDSGHLSGAVLDVFDPEPLPASSRLWAHPRVRLFPHVSSMTNIDTAVAQMLINRELVLTGRQPPAELVVDWEAGY